MKEEMERKIATTEGIRKQMERQGWRCVDKATHNGPYRANGWLMERPKRHTTKAEGEVR